jgi:hypothetical protein
LSILTKSNSQISADELAAHHREQQAKTPVVNRLSAYVSKAFRDAEMHRQTTGITERLLKCRRLRDGKYDAQMVAQIEAKGGCQTFFNITEPKCEGFEAWMGEIFTPAGDDRPWDCKPTPIPTLPKNSAKQVVDMTVEQFAAASPDEPLDPDAITEYAQKLYDDTLKLLYDDAYKRCERMVTKMNDQATEGGFTEAMTEFIRDFSMYMTAFLKGPVMTRRDRIGWKDGQVKKTSEIIPTWSCPDPNDIYPGTNSRSINESYICEVVNFDRRKLSEMRGVDGWSTEAIEAVLGIGGPTAQAVGSDLTYLAGESERAQADNRDQMVNNGMPDATLRGIEFWGSVQGSMLTEWGMKNVEDRYRFYEVHCVMVNGIVIRTVMNADPLGRRPYFAASVSKNKGSIWGHRGIPERMEDCQDAVNGSSRNLINNLAMASGPMVTADMDLIPPEHAATIHKIYPWRVYPFRGNKSTNSRDPIRFFQPNSNAGELMQVAEYFTQLADERTNVPRYTTGNAEVGGAGETASGLGMLMDASTRGLKRHVKSIDNSVMRPAIERLYTWNMLNLDDPSLKGDVQVVPRGALAMLTRQQTQMRRQEFLAMTMNDTDMQIIGIEGRAIVLREIAKGLDLPVDKIVPDEETLRARFQQALVDQGGGAPADGPSDDPGGEPSDDEEAA